MYLLTFYVPKSHLETVKEALFTAGAGQIGNYQKCAWQTLGEGQFLPQAGSDPYLGKVGSVEKVAEYKVELVCRDAIVAQVIRALKQAHPYEQPAYQVWQLDNAKIT